MCWLIAAYTDCCTLTALFSCTCPFQYAHNVESHWCLHPENEPNLIYFCDWKICRLYPQSPSHIITITRRKSLYLIWGICQCHVTNILNSGIHRFIVSEDGYLCALSTMGKITLLRLVPVSHISKVVLCQILRYITVFLLCFQVVVGVSSASGKLQLVFDVSSAEFVNDFTDFQVTVNICLVWVPYERCSYWCQQDNGSLIEHRRTYNPSSDGGKNNINGCSKYRAASSLFDHLKQK